MGRTLLTLAVLGLLGWGGKWIYDSLSAGPPVPAAEAGPEASPGPGGLPGAGGTARAGSGTSLRETGGAPGARTAAPAAPHAGAAPAAAALRALLASGQARDAVAKARELAPEVLREPAVTDSALEAARALAAAPGAGPADRTARADEARRLYGRLFTAGAAPWSAVEEPLAALNREVLHAGREVPGTIFRYTVRPGDTLDRLLRREWKGRVRAGHGLLLHLNSIPSPDRLRAAPISVPEEPVRVLVSKGAHRLWVLLGEVPLRSWPVGLGSHGRTPEGTFVIEELMPKPDYWPPGGGKIPYGAEGNPLGTRWIGFRDTPEAQGIGIHGTDDPSSIGRDLSQGCVRLLNADVEILFGWVAAGCEVEIRR